MGNFNASNAVDNQGSGLLSRVMPAVCLLCVTAGIVWISTNQTFEAMQNAKKAPPSLEEYRQQLQNQQAELNAMEEQAQKSTRAVAAVLVKDARQAIVKKDYPKAINLTSEIVQVDPANAGAYHVRGIAYYMTGKMDVALADLSKTISLAPRNAEAYLYRGLVYSKQNNHQTAVEDFSQAIKINAQYGAAYYYRGLTRQKLGQSELAQADFRKALDLGVQQASDKVK